MPEPEHATSLTVWDLASPVIVDRRATLKIGVSCLCGCNLAGSRIDVYNQEGVPVGGGTLRSVPWPASAALYWTAVEVAPPSEEGEQSWTIRATTPEPTHSGTTSIVRFFASRPPEHQVTLEVIDKGTGGPLPGVELRVGRFRATTDAAGIAHVEVPGGTYEVGTWKNGYEVLSQTAVIASDTTVHLELTAEPEVERPYWM